MSFFKVNTNEENVKDYTGNGNNFLNNSGMYEVILKAVIAETSPNGSNYINLWIDHNGQEQAIYQAIRLTNNDGSPNLGQKLFNKLAVICGATEGQDIPDPVRRMVPIGEKGEEKECMVLEVFDDTPIIIRLQMEYYRYNEEIKDKKNIRNVFRFVDKATAAEIVNGTEVGKQYTMELEFAGKDDLKDGITPEDVEVYKKNKRSNKKKETETSIKPKGGFGGKKFGNK